MPKIGCELPLCRESVLCLGLPGVNEIGRKHSRHSTCDWVAPAACRDKLTFEDLSVKLLVDSKRQFLASNRANHPLGQLLLHSIISRWVKFRACDVLLIYARTSRFT